ncbi:hypothetical protein ACJ73_02801 [Blastomyces percursus]|uniref:Uncharacterized protein n=1 Tax=Blastomyces percursus TaxID=1658174 RepID=A0A1J9QBA6_9EURO|nr:hypothetical protein ACJ73_02801 [Blastomyces percursus]
MFQKLNVNSKNPACQVDFIVNKTQKLSAIHLFALCPSNGTSDSSQISARVIQAVLAAFNTTECINYVHRYRTPRNGGCANSPEITMRVDQLSEKHVQDLGLTRTWSNKECQIGENTPLLLAQFAFEAHLSELEKSPFLEVYRNWIALRPWFPIPKRRNIRFKCSLDIFKKQKEAPRGPNRALHLDSAVESN